MITTCRECTGSLWNRWSPNTLTKHLRWQYPGKSRNWGVRSPTNVERETVVDLNAPKRPQPKPEWQTVIQKVAPGFNVRNVGEGGVVEHKTFRNATAVQTHPLHKNRASSLHRTAAIPTDKKTTLHMRVSHHPHGDWQLRVLADGKMIENQLVSSKTVGKDEWMEVSVDLDVCRQESFAVH